MTDQTLETLLARFLHDRDFINEESMIDAERAYLSLVAIETNPNRLLALMKQDREVLLLTPELAVATFQRILALGLRTAEALRLFAFYLDAYGGTDAACEGGNQMSWPEAEALAQSLKEEADGIDPPSRLS